MVLDEETLRLLILEALVIIMRYVHHYDYAEHHLNLFVTRYKQV